MFARGEAFREHLHHRLALVFAEDGQPDRITLRIDQWDFQVLEHGDRRRFCHAPHGSGVLRGGDQCGWRREGSDGQGSH